MLTIEIQFFPYNCYSLFQNKLIFQTDSKISHALQLKVATTTKHWYQILESVRNLQQIS